MKLSKMLWIVNVALGAVNCLLNVSSGNSSAALGWGLASVYAIIIVVKIDKESHE